MRMRPHVEARARRLRGGAHVIEEDERADGARGERGQRAAHGQVADVAHVRFQDGFDRIGHGWGEGSSERVARSCGESGMCGPL